MEEPEEFPFPTIIVKAENGENKSSVIHRRLTMEKREKTTGERGRTEAGCSSDHKEEEQTDSSDTDHSEDYGQEQTQAKRSYAMIPPDSHVKNHKAFSCSVCGKKFTRNSLLKRHMLFHTSKKTRNDPKIVCYICTVCKQPFPNNASLKEHINIIHHSCQICDTSFPSNIELKSHLRVHEMEKYRCHECGKCFASNYHLKRHKKIHIPVSSGETVCSVCQNVFQYKCDYYRHLNEVHRTCPVCETAFADEISLNAHLKAHMKEKRQDPLFSGNEIDRCSDCGKKLQSNSHLWLYIIGYTGGKPHKCSVCGQHFGFLCELPQHLQQVHHMCPLCQDFFTDEAELSEHQAAHEMMKRYSCSECGKRFRLRSSLNTHMNGHTGVKPYRCSVCRINFTTKGNLQRHLKAHTRQNRIRRPRNLMFEKGLNAENSLEAHTAQGRSSTEFILLSQSQVVNIVKDLN